MQVGDLITYQGILWLVRKMDDNLATAFLESSAGSTVTVGYEIEHTVECNPLVSWPYAQLPSKRLGRLKSVHKGYQTLVPLVDWVKIDDFQIGGLIYLNPALNLGFGDRLIVCYVNRPDSREVRASVDIPRMFKPMAAKLQAKKTAIVEPTPEPTVYSRLMDDDDI